MKVKPVPGRSVRDPKTMILLPPEGREVKDGDPFWMRRIRDGDVTVEKSASQAKPTTSQPGA
jgi:hypothetical protein